LRILVFEGNRAATNGRNARGSTRAGRGPGEDKLLKSAMGQTRKNSD